MRIFLDMDGVLTNFWGRFEQVHGKPNKEVVADIGYDEYLKCLETYGEGFWSFMPWMNDGKELWEYIKNYGRDIKIISKPVNTPSCIPGKLAWCMTELGVAEEICIFDYPKEQYCLNHNDILIDDDLNNVSKWREAGGQAILHTSAKCTKAILEDISKLMFSIEAKLNRVIPEYTPVEIKVEVDIEPLPGVEHITLT